MFYKMLRSLCIFLLHFQSAICSIYEPLTDLNVSNKLQYTTIFNIALKQENTIFLENELIKISDPTSYRYGEFYSIDKIHSLVSPSLAQKIPLYSWLKLNNIEIIRDYGDRIQAISTLYNLDKVFNVDMKQYKYGNNLLFRSIKPYTIPTSLKYIIVFIEGISNPIYKKEMVFSKSSVKNNISVDNNFIGRESFYNLYNITTDLYCNENKTITSIASIEYQGNSGFSIDDLHICQTLNNVENSSTVYVVGNNSIPDTESELDIQMMGINLVPDKTNLWFWVDNNWLYSLASDMASRVDVPHIISMSWGWSETDQCTIINCTNVSSYEYVNRVNVEYIKLGLRGITITVSSGDAGAPGRTSEECDEDNPLNAIFPGSSNWVLSIGGTFVVKNNNTVNWTTPLCQKYGCTTGTDELVTNYNNIGWTSGGGFSKYNQRYFWQSKFIEDYFESGKYIPKQTQYSGRAYPDVSIVGHYCPTVEHGNVEGIDGTSCSSPLFATIISILNNYQQANGRPRLGFVNPIMYMMYNTNPLIFNDIQVGNNSCTEYKCCRVNEMNGSDFGYEASIGYDPVYGLGTPNVGLMKEWLDMYT
jgi:tripeptidyl-peptidase-1